MRRAAASRRWPALAAPLGVRVAVEVIPNELSRAGSLVALHRGRARAAGVGICLDFGHAQLDGDVVDAIETVSEHLVATHVHDNRGRIDDHLLPFDGTIDWPAALIAVQKVGYEGPLVFEVGQPRADEGDSAEARARARADAIGCSTEQDASRMHVYIEDIGKHEGEEVTIKGWLHNRRSSGKIHFLILRDGTGFIQAVMSKAAVGDEVFKAADHLSQETSLIVTGTARADKRAPSGYEIDVKQLEVVGESHDYPITPKEHGVDYLLDRRHLWIRSERQQAILRVRHEIINAVRDFFNSRGFILADTPIFTPAACEGTTTLFPVAVLRGTDGVSDAERAAVQRSECDGARPGLLLRPDVPRREVEDAPPPHRVLDGRARDGLRRSRRRDGPRRGSDRVDVVARVLDQRARAN